MKIFIYLLMMVIVIYTSGFSYTLWKEKNKIGAVAVLTLAIIVAVAPFFTILK